MTSVISENNSAGWFVATSSHTARVAIGWCLLDGTLSHSLRDSESQPLCLAAGLDPDMNHSSVGSDGGSFLTFAVTLPNSEGKEPLIRRRKKVRRRSNAMSVYSSEQQRVCQCVR